MSNMRVTYDESANAAYIELIGIGPGGVVNMYACDPVAVGGMINLDFNSKGQLVGIEILDARRMLPADLLGEGEAR